AALFRRDVLDYALPFPPEVDEQKHDHWIAIVAMALGDIHYVPRPLYDYVQHAEAELGHAAANQGSPSSPGQRLETTRSHGPLGAADRRAGGRAARSAARRRGGYEQIARRAGRRALQVLRGAVAGDPDRRHSHPAPPSTSRVPDAAGTEGHLVRDRPGRVLR